MARQQKAVAEPFTYVLIDDRSLPLEFQTRFTFRPLTASERLAALDSANMHAVVNGEFVSVGRAFQEARRLVGMCLTNVENMLDKDDKPVTWPADPKKRDEFIDAIAPGDLWELRSVVMERSVLSAAEKNSSAPAAT